MKKSIMLSLTAGAVLSLCSCANQGGSGSSSGSPAVGPGGVGTASETGVGNVGGQAGNIGGH
ncbi:MAG: hypothetical protein H0X40_11475 [Chthoniobacterales bacterium]|nr:hypothetical protein [Chthoniobacterales bacterium]